MKTCKATNVFATMAFLVIWCWSSIALAAGIIHDAEYYILKGQNGEKWAAEDQRLDAKLAELKRKHGRPPNIVYILWDDMTFGAVGFPGLQKNFGFDTPNINRMAAEGMNFTRMYSEPSCTPTRAAFLTGRVMPVTNRPFVSPLSLDLV